MAKEKVTSTVRGLSTEVELSEADGVRKPCVVNLDHLQLVPERSWYDVSAERLPAP